VTVTDLARVSGGSSREIWGFTAQTGADAPQALILRTDPPGEQRDGGAALEGQLMRRAHDAGIKVPRILALVADRPELPGGGLVMERLSGETLPRRILDNPDLAEARTGLAAETGFALGRLHGIDPDSIAGLPSEDRLASYRQTLDRLDPDRPVLELAYQWLIANRPERATLALVHGDFRLGNFIVDRTGLVGVLDWESAHRGDPLEDIGWIAVKTWRFRGAGVIGGFGEVIDFLTAYESAGVDWALVFGTWVWAVGCLQQADRHLSGLTRSVDLAMVGRRVVEVEYDLLELLS
jgi:aminoglycoside phosphotransferase (APT) family kinase protein